jgi:hypothetical protein
MSSIATIFLALSLICTISSVVPYARDILRRTTKPNIASWIVWTALTGVATIVQFAAGETTTAIITLAAALETLVIVILGLRYGYADFGRFEWVCLLGALAGLMIWLLLDNPVLAVLLTVLIDLAGSLPTVRHSWLSPGEETWLTYLAAGLGGLFGLLALTSFTVVSLAYPIYLAGMNAILVAIILWRQRVASDH